MDVAITAVAATLKPILLDMGGELAISFSSLAQRRLKPSVVTTWVNIQRAAKQSYRVGLMTSFYKSVSFFDSLAKNTAASFRMFLSC